MLPTLASIAHGIRALLRPRFDLAIENAALRLKLAVLKQKRPRPRLNNSDRFFWVTLRRFWSRWPHALIVVKPETVTRWHRQGFGYFWRWKSRRRGRPRTDREIRVLIVSMATENRWRAPRIHAELRGLGLTGSERWVSRYLQKNNPATSTDLQETPWRNCTPGDFTGVSGSQAMHARALLATSRSWLACFRAEARLSATLAPVPK